MVSEAIIEKHSKTKEIFTEEQLDTIRKEKKKKRKRKREREGLQYRIKVANK